MFLVLTENTHTQKCVFCQISPLLLNFKRSVQPKVKLSLTQRTLQMKGSLWLCDFTQLELTAVLCQQPSVPPNFVCDISHPAFPKTWACTIFYSSGIVWIGGGGFGRVGARREWCRWQLWLLSSARGMPQPACDAAVFCIQGKQLYPVELSGGITHHWRHGSPDAENILFYFPSRKFEWQTSGDNGKQLGVIDSTTGIRPTVLIWDDSSSLSSGDVIETKLWYRFSHSVELTEHLKQVHLHSPWITDCCWLQKLSSIQVMFRFKTACRLIWLLCHKVIYYPWSWCVFLDTPQCHSSRFSSWCYGHMQGQYQW